MRNLDCLLASSSLALLTLAGCGQAGSGTGPNADLSAGMGGPNDDLSASGSADMSAPDDLALPSPAASCIALGLPQRAFNAGGPYGLTRDATAEDFTLTDQNGDWNLAKNWSGCDSYIFVPDNIPISPLDKTSIWSQDLDALLSKSNDGEAKNVHYFFISTHVDPTASLADIQGQLDGALAQFPDGDMPGSKSWWRARVHFVKTPLGKITNWVAKVIRGQQVGNYGFGIDRFQKLRGLGNFADVNRFDANLQAKMQWPWQNNMAYAAHPAIYFNYEAKRQDAIDAEKGVTVITVYDSEMLGGGHQKDVMFPDAQTMATFDTFEIDLTMNCPDPNTPEEANNCGAWDYLAGISFQVNYNDPTDAGAPQPDWREAARFITTYHRAGRFTLTANHFLPYLAKGGMQHLNLDVSGQTYQTTLVFRLFKAGAGAHPTQANWLFGGGGLDQNYDPARMTPISVPIPKTAKRVELHAIITGHGNPGCAEFCNIEQVFTVNGTAHTKSNPETADGSLGDQEGCLKKANIGAVPNQSGTWWFGRDGWCPGMQVDPWVVDVTRDVTPGQTATVAYKALYKNTPPNRGLGNIDMSSWLVVWE